MNIKLKFLLNLIVIEGIFLAFKPGKETIENYGLSVAIVALAATFFEIYIGGRRAASGDPKAKRDSLSLLMTVLALAGAGIAAVVVPRMRESDEQEQIQQLEATTQRSETDKMLADPKVQQGMKIFEALQNGTYTTGPTTMPATMPTTSPATTAP